MPKQVLQITNFAGGLNAYSDARDIEDNQFVQNWNAVVDKNGIIRVSGMAADAGVNTDSFDNTYFQKGYGLFQFSTDYSFSIISGDFSNGVKSGTLSIGSGFAVGIATLEATYAGTLNEFAGMQIFIYKGTGIGQSRRIASNTAATPTVLTLSDNLLITPDATSKYIIFPWKLDGTKWFGSALNKNVITNGFNSATMISGISKSDKDYYIAAKKTASDNSSTNLGYIEYPANTTKALTIKPGVNYILSFDCAAKSKWHNAVSDGDEDGADLTTIGDKVPWVQLYSDTVADTKGSIKTHSATATLSAAWSVNGTFYSIPAYSSTGNGRGALFDIVVSTTSVTGDTATFYVRNRGEGYKATEVLTFKDPEGGAQTGTITVTSINNNGLSLGRNGWIKKSDQIHNTEIISDESEVAISTSAVTLTVDGTTATDNLIKDRYLYKYDGTRIGLCTTVNSGTEIVLDGAEVTIPNDTALYLSNYLDERHNNYIDNGDFADGVPSHNGTANAWTEVDTGGVLVCSELAGDGYDGDDGTCRMVSAGMSSSEGVPESYIYQDLVLDDLTSYDLNFLYDSHHGIKYAVYNNDKSKYIVDWESLGGTKLGETSNVNFSYPLDNISTVNPDSENKSMKYITFSLDKSTTGSTAGIRILFSPVFADSTVDLHGVTLFKAHHDLASMSYNKDAANPFFQNIQFFNRYSFSFKLPINYTTVTDWKLLLHAGQFGYRANNILDAEDTQQVYFDNISLLAEENDTITVLTDNRVNSSNPMFYSANSDSWVNNLVRWNNQNSKSNYDYINGMLKICDSNFDSGNPQAIVYHDKDRGWRANYDLIPSPPEVFSRVYDDTELADERFNAIDYFNTKYEGQYFDFQSGAYGQTNKQNWKLDQFGAGVHQGILLAHVHGAIHPHSNEDDHFPKANDLNETPALNSPKALYDMDRDYYKAHFTDNIENIEKEDGGIEDFAAVAGWTFNQSNDFSNMVQGSRVTGDGWTSKTFHVKGHHPLLNENIGMHDLASSNVDKIHSIDFTFLWELFGRWGEATGAIDGQVDGPQAPKFVIRWGPVMDNSHISEVEETRFQGRYKIDNDKGGIMLLGYNQIAYSMHKLFDENKNKYEYYGEDEEILKEYSYTCSDEYLEGEIKARIKFELNLPFTGVETLSADTNLAVSVIVKEGNVTTSYRTLLERVGEGNGIWRRSIKVADNTADWDDIKSVNHGSGYYKGNRLGRGTSCWERLMVEKFDVRYTSKSYIDTSTNFNLSPHQYAIGSKNGVQANFAFGALENSSGWAQRIFVLAATSVNRFGEESAFHPGVERIGEDFSGSPNIQHSEAPSITVGMTASQLGDSYIKETKFYMRDTESDIWYLQFYINHKKKRMYSSTSAISSPGRLVPTSNIYEWTLDRENFKNFNEISSYESETMVSQEDGERNSSLVADYKTSVVANNRLYAGNIKQGNVVYGDRMAKSPIGKYNILPASNFIDVAINDGDEITALAYYKDKLLQFKKRKVYQGTMNFLKIHLIMLGYYIKLL